MAIYPCPACNRNEHHSCSAKKIGGVACSCSCKLSTLSTNVRMDNENLCFACNTLLVADLNALFQFLRIIVYTLNGNMDFTFALPMMERNLRQSYGELCHRFKHEDGCLSVILI